MTVRIVRMEAGGERVFCLEHEDGGLELCSGSPLAGDLRPLGRPVPVGGRRLAPVDPSKIVVVGRNYLDHIQESRREVPDEPLISLKPPTAVIGPDEAIEYPPGVSRVDPEAELAVVIGQRARHLQEDEALSCVLGYTCLNDVTARELQRKDVQWTRGKGFDTFCPLGPAIVTEIDPQDLELRCLVNGEVRQIAHTRDMLYPVRRLVSFISHVMTLVPGDVIATGTPAGIAPVQPGDRLVVDISRIGRLENPVVAGK